MTLDEATLNSARRVIRRANFRLKAEENEAAFSLFEKALEYIPESVEIMNVLGALTIKMGNLDDGIRYYRDSLGFKEQIETQIELGFALINNNQVEEAHELFTELDQHDTEVMAGLGISLVILNQDLQNAVKLLVAADKYNLKINISTYLGLAYFQLGQYNKALTEFRKNWVSWENVHAAGVQYLGMNSRSVANHAFIDALKKYKDELGEENLDETILSKLNFDIMLSNTEPNERIQDLLTVIKDGEANLETYLALIATQYDISFYDAPFEEYVKKALEFIDDDQIELKDQLNVWLEKSKEEGN